MHSESRTDAIVLAALMEVDPEYPLTVKVVRGLIEARVRGIWENTQANAFALLALSRYHRHFEKVVPDYRLRAWLGSGFLGQTTFKGRTMRVYSESYAHGRSYELLDRVGIQKEMKRVRDARLK